MACCKIEKIAEDCKNLPLSKESLIDRFDGPPVESLVVMGSYARGNAGRFSDVDLVRFLSGEEKADLAPGGFCLEQGCLLVVSDVTLLQTQACFTDPDKITECLIGLRNGPALPDRDGCFAAFQERARRFKWTAELQAKRVSKAAEEMVAWIEEVHKGLQGLRERHTGRLLNARFGLSWGLTKGPDCSLPDLVQQVDAGLKLYVVTAALFAGQAQMPGRELVLIQEPPGLSRISCHSRTSGNLESP